MKDAQDETLILSERIIQDLSAKIVTDIGALYKASEAVALVDRKSTLQVGEREGRLTVAAVRGADELEQRLVLRDGGELSGTERPARRCEVAGEHPDLADVGIGHGGLLKLATGRCPGGRCRS